MYGLISKFKAQNGKRDALIAIMTVGAVKMPGCISYVVAKDPTDADGIWITEIWDSKESHAGSLNIPEVKATIQKAMPLIGGFDHRFETEPVDVA
jgi:quinol monooxygenase YgiN